MFVYVAYEDVQKFMDDVKPKYRLMADFTEHDLEFEFSDEEDYKRALEWIYNKYPSDVYGTGGKILGTIYFDRVVAYGFVCHLDDHAEDGFSNPDDAEAALLDYCGNDI